LHFYTFNQIPCEYHHLNPNFPSKPQNPLKRHFWFPLRTHNHTKAVAQLPATEALALACAAGTCAHKQSAPEVITATFISTFELFQEPQLFAAHNLEQLPTKRSK
jgi:hypothetical protein